MARPVGELTRTEISFGGGDGPATMVRTVEVRLDAKRDVAAERARLDRELADATETVRRSRALLADGEFARKAPPDVVAKERARLAEREERLRLLEAETKKRRA
jgi:valyl-tRNA synthetase